MSARNTANEGKNARAMAQMAVHMAHTHEVQWRNGKAPNTHIMGLMHAALHREPGSIKHAHSGAMTSIDQDLGLANTEKPVKKAGFRIVNDYQPKPYDSNGEGADETVICPRDGSGNADDAKYCDQCGFHLQGADGVQVKK